MEEESARISVREISPVDEALTKIEWDLWGCSDRAALLEKLASEQDVLLSKLPVEWRENGARVIELLTTTSLQNSRYFWGAYGDLMFAITGDANEICGVGAMSPGPEAEIPGSPMNMYIKASHLTFQIIEGKGLIYPCPFD